MKTFLDIYNSADNAAKAAAVLSDPFDLQDAPVSAFKAEKGDRADWPQWKQFFDQRQGTYRQLAANLEAWAKQPSASAIAAARQPKPAPAPTGVAPKTA